MNKDGNVDLQYFMYTENTRNRTTPSTSVKRTSPEDDGKVGMLGATKSKNQQNLRQDSFVETDANTVSFKNAPVLSENIGRNVREAISQNKTYEEKRSFIVKVTKQSEAGKENRQMTTSLEPDPKEHSPRSQLCSENKYITNLDLKQNEIKDSFVKMSPNRLHPQKVLLSEQNTGLVNAKAKIQNSLKGRSILRGLLSREGKDIKEDNGTVPKFSLEPDDLPNNAKCGKKNVTCIITKAVCPFDHQSSHPGPFVVTFGQPDPGQKSIELLFECFHIRTTDGSQTVLAPNTKTNSIDGKQEERCSTETETRYSKQVYSFTLEEQCLEESNAIDQNLPREMSKPITVQEENTSQKLKEVSEKITPVSTLNSTCSTISQTEQKRGARSNDRHIEVSPESCLAICLAKTQKNDHCYARRFCKSEKSEEKHHTENKNPNFKLSEDSSSNLLSPREEVKNVEDINPPFPSVQDNSSHHGLQVKGERNFTEDTNLLFPSTEDNSLYPWLQVEEQKNHTGGRNPLSPSAEVNSSNFGLQESLMRNHNEDWWGFYTLMNIGVLMHKLPVKEAKSIENDNIQLPSINLSEETSAGNDGIGWRNTSHDAWDSWRLLSEVSTSADPLPVYFNYEQESDFEINENTESNLSSR